ncbi:hypothetical protein JF535_08900 [Microbulbifer salipaludis]|uniref:Transposase n=1 Tax=Microbulbifer salipaludis TaxID=187980 RepID=A0ABS3E6Q6_9GAMM|nr:hypothetical protein [Microbulbifer salipaludis]
MTLEAADWHKLDYLGAHIYGKSRYGYKKTPLGRGGEAREELALRRKQRSRRVNRN